MGDIRQRRSSASSKVVVDKDKTDKFARNSPTLSHLYRYPHLVNGVDQVVNLPLINVLLSWVLVLAARVRSFVVESSRTPRFIKIGYNLATGAFFKVDELFAILVLREGLGALIEEWGKHGSRPGLWLAYFWVDYWANVVNILLAHFVLGSNKLAATPVGLPIEEEHSLKQQHSLRHLEELATTAKSISTEFQERIRTGYIDKTTGFARNKYHELFKPVADKIQTEYVEPTRTHALDTYKTVSSTYETNLHNSESVPRAVVSTGFDLRNITLENLKSSTAEVVEEEAKKIQEEAQSQSPKAQRIPTNAQASKSGSAE